MKRKHYIDNIRSLTVLLVIIYHAFYLFNGVGIQTGFSNGEGFWLYDAICTFVYPWFMVLLFLVAGVSARHSIDKRGKQEFLRERVRKLIIPSTLGLLVLHWISGYINIKVGGGLEYMPSILVYPISALSGTGPLWFSQTVFVFSFLLVVFYNRLTTAKLDKLCERTNGIVIIAFLLLIFLGAQLLNVPVISVYRFGIYGVAFFLGYLFFYFDKIIEKCVKLLPISISCSIVLGIVYMCMHFGKNYASDEVLKNFVTNAYAWFSILTIIGTAKKWLNKTNRVLNYLNKISFGLYILHYLVLTVVGYVLYEYFANVPVYAKGIILLIAMAVLTPILNRLIERTPFLRYCVLGIKRRKNEIQVDN
ncbi:MAG: acyltransferase [Clostridia bacterium]|nr:acyltransferase [Clostridia bacterium]